MIPSPRRRKLNFEHLALRKLLVSDLTPVSTLPLVGDGEGEANQIELRVEGQQTATTDIAEGQRLPVSLHFSEVLSDPLYLPFYFRVPEGSALTADDFMIEQVGPEGILPAEGSLGAPNWVYLPAGSQDYEFAVAAIVDSMADAGETLLFSFDTSQIPDGFQLASPSGGELTVTFSEPQIDLLLERWDALTSEFVPLNGSSLYEGDLIAVRGRLRDAILDTNVTIELESTGNATTPEDFEMLGGSLPSTLSIYAGSPESDRILFIVKDDTDARRETLGFSGQALENIVTVKDSVAATIADDEIRPVVSMSLVNPTIVEGDALITDYGVTSDLPGAVTLHVELDQAVTRNLTVDVKLSGDATPGVDYTLWSNYIFPSATLVGNVVRLYFPAGSTSIEFQLAGAEMSDPHPENDETVIATLDVSNSEYEAGRDYTQSAVIVDTDGPPTVDLEFATGNVSEGASSILLQATLSKRFLAHSLPITYVGPTRTPAAEPTRDFIPSYSLFIPAGARHGGVAVAMMNDSEYELDEWMYATVDLAQAPRALITDQTPAEARIIDDDPASVVTMTIDQSNVTEGTQAAITFEVTPPAQDDVLVYLRASGTAIPNRHGNFVIADYTLDGQITGADAAHPDSFVIRIPASLNGGPQRTQVSLLAQHDEYDEPQQESIILTMSGVSGASYIPGTTIQSVVEDIDAPPFVTLDYPVNWVDIAEQNMFVGVWPQLSAISEFPITVSLETAGTALLFEDYDLPEGQVVVIPPGEREGASVIRFLDNNVHRSTDPVVELRIRQSDVINADASQSMPIRIRLRDNDPAPILNLVNVSGNADLFEGAQPNMATLRAQLDGVVVDYDLHFTLAGSGTAQLGTSGDAVLSSSTITIPARTAWSTTEVTVVDDTISESDLETLNLSITDASVTAQGVVAGVLNQVLTIHDNENKPQVTLSTDSSQLAESGQVTVTATLTTPVQTSTVIQLVYSGDATANEDYRPVTSITIPAGRRTASARIRAIQDRIYERDESIVVAVDPFTTTIARAGGPASLTLVDDETIPRVTRIVNESPPAEVREGESRQLQVELSGPSKFPILIGLGYDGVGSPASTPYADHVAYDFLVLGMVGGVETNSLAEILPGQTSAMLELRAIEDSIDEPNERLRVSIARVDINNGFNNDDAVFNFATTPASLAYTILDNNAPPIVAFHVAGVNSNRVDIAEGLQPASLLIELRDDRGRSIVSGQDVTVVIGFNGTGTVAASRSDYQLSIGGQIIGQNRAALVIPAGASSSQPISVAAVLDGLDEEDLESLAADVVSVKFGTTLSGNSDRVVLDVLDRDTAPHIRLLPLRSSVSEGFTFGLRAEIYDPTTGNATVSGRTVSAHVDSPNLSTFELPPAMLNAISAVDYVLLNSTFIIPPGRTFVEQIVSVTDDTFAEGPEMIAFTIDAATNALSANSNRVSTVIRANDPVTGVSLSAIKNLTETADGQAANSTTIGVTLSQPAPQGGVRVAINFNRSPSPWDFSVRDLIAPQSVGLAGDALIVIAEGAVQGSVILEALSDNVYEGTQSFSVEIAGVDASVPIQVVNSQQSFKLLDDDRRPTVRISSTGTNITEGQQLNVHVALSWPTTLPLCGRFTSGSTDAAIYEIDYRIEDYCFQPSRPGNLSVSQDVVLSAFHDTEISESRELGTYWSEYAIEVGSFTTNRQSVAVMNNPSPILSIEGPRTLRPISPVDAGQLESQLYTLRFNQMLQGWTLRARSTTPDTLQQAGITFQNQNTPSDSFIFSSPSKTAIVRLQPAPNASGRLEVVFEAINPAGTVMVSQLLTVEIVPLPNACPVFTPTLTFASSFEDDASAKGDSITELIQSGEASQGELDFDPESIWLDPDTNSQQGLAIVGIHQPVGLRSIEYTTDGGLNWTPVGPVSASHALLLRAGDPLTRLRARLLTNYTYEGPSVYGIQLLDYRAWDQTEGQNGTYYNTDQSLQRYGSAFGLSLGSIQLGAVENINDAPQLLAKGLIFDQIRDSEAMSNRLSPALGRGEYYVGAMANSHYNQLLLAMRDPDGQITDSRYTGIAVFESYSASGTWQYRELSGSWKSMNDIHGGRGTDLQHAILLSTSSQIRFIPYNDNWSGREELRFVMWDGAVVVGIDSTGEEIVRTERPGDVVDISQPNRGGISPFSQLSAAYRVSGK